MRKIVSFLMIVSLMLTFGFNVKSQINRTINTKIADALAQVPTRDEAKLNSLMSELVDLREAGFALFVAKVVPPGTADDVAARFIIASMSKYTSRFGRTTDKLMVENGLL